MLLLVLIVVQIKDKITTVEVPKEEQKSMPSFPAENIMNISEEMLSNLNSKCFHGVVTLYHVTKLFRPHDGSYGTLKSEMPDCIGTKQQRGTTRKNATTSIIYKREASSPSQNAQGYQC